MHFFFPSKQGQQSLEELSNQSLLTPFHPLVLSFIQALSLKFVKMRQYPEIVALGYWMRKANIISLQERWQQDTAGRVIKAKGTIFHIAPSNVDTIFIYSWLLSLLAGNRNIIRLSRKEQPQQHLIMQALLSALEDPAYSELAKRNTLLTYDHDDHKTAQLSQLCHVRVVWGGDQTVNAIRRISLSPMASELVFPDRFSSSLIHAEALNKLSSDELLQLAGQFYNDAYWFDQLACSSPRLVVWHGEQGAVEQAQQLFWNAVEQVFYSKETKLQPAQQVQKLTTGLWLTSEQEAISMQHSSVFSRVEFSSLPDDIRERHCGGGFFLEHTITELSELVDLIADKDQTLSYFGYHRAELEALAEAILSRGIDRIVPIGKALDFQEVWDGQSFLRSFTREINIL